jgi:hypothetical protein
VRHLDQRTHGATISDGDQCPRGAPGHLGVLVLQARDELRHGGRAAAVGQHTDGVVAHARAGGRQVGDQLGVSFAARLDLVLQGDHRLLERRIERRVERGVARRRVEAVVRAGGPARLPLGQQPIDVALRPGGGGLQRDGHLGHLALGGWLSRGDHRRGRQRALGAVDLQPH